MAASNGRRSKLTTATIDQIVQLVAAGNYLEVAAAYIGVRKATLFEWLRKGRAELELGHTNVHTQLVARVEQALAQAEMRDLTLIGQAAKDEWQAAAWRLERKFPDRYGRRTRLDGNIQVSAAPMVDLSKLTLDEQVELRRLLVKGAPQQEELATGQAPALELLPGGAEGAT